MISWLEEGLYKLNPDKTKDKKGGYTRLGYSDKEWIAIKGFIELSKQLGLNVRRDAAGNVIATWIGKDPSLPVTAFGSHLDTVKQGGKFDGPAGIIAALGMVKALKEESFKPKRSVEVICFVCEESSRFGVSTLGSKAMAGLLKIDQIKDLVDKQGISIKKALSLQGLDLFKVNSAARSPQEIYSFVELHIEQGTVLERSEYDLGIVSGISTPIRYRITIHGQAGHTGTTPMGKRKDALAAAGKLITFVEELGKKQADKDHIVATVSIIDAYPNVMNVIPETVSLGVDIRSINDALKEETGKIIQEFCKILERKRDLKIRITELVNEPSVLMNQQVIESLMQAAERANIKVIQINSGAGHDAMNMAKKWPAGMIFIPCRHGISHHPDEYADINDIYKGTKVLMEYLKLSNE